MENTCASERARKIGVIFIVLQVLTYPRRRLECPPHISSAVNKENWKTVTEGRRRANASRRKCHLVRYAEPVRSDLSRSSTPIIAHRPQYKHLIDQLQENDDDTSHEDETGELRPVRKRYQDGIQHKALHTAGPRPSPCT